MQVKLAKCKQFVQAIAPSGNLFLVLALRELRQQGLTFIAFYVLQRTIQEKGSSESALRRETGLADYEISRACKLLASKGLVEMGRNKEDKRVRALRPTELGIKIQDQLLSVAAKQLQESFSAPVEEDDISGAGDNKRLAEAAQSFRDGNQTLRGAFQVSLFDLLAHKSHR
jgi:DNA-binding MarR family transcriptional regulator